MTKNESQLSSKGASDQLKIVNVALEQLFLELAELAHFISEMPVAIITFHDEEVQWANVSITQHANYKDYLEFARHVSHKNSGVDVEITNDLKDTSVSNKSSDIKYSFFTQLCSAGNENIGTLCIIDNKENALSELKKKALQGLAKSACLGYRLTKSANREIQSKDSILAAIIESSEDAIVSKTLNGIVLSWNHSAEKLFGYTEQEMFGNPITKIFPLDKINEEAEFIRRIKNNEHVRHYETVRLNKKGHLIDISVSLSPIKGAGGEIIGIAKIARDISTQKKLQKTIAEGHERLRVTLNSIGDAVIATDVNGIVQYQNPAAELLTGWVGDEVVGMPLHLVFNIVNEKTRLPLQNPVEACVSENRVIGLANHTLLVSRNGGEFSIEDSAAPIRDNNGQIIGVVLVFHDVTAQRKMVNEMSYRASHDSLTKLINRAEFEVLLLDTIKNQADSGMESALMFIDLDQFKVVNDTCGHSVGDKLLIEVSQVMKSCIRKSDAIARVGGDEFAIILENCNQDASLKIAKLICKSIDEYRLYYNNQRFHVSASIGIVFIDRPWTSINSLLQAADSACYIAKNNGRNRVHIYFDADYAIEKRRSELNWISKLEYAIENNGFVLYCQRIFPLSQSESQHAEVLIRMIDETDNLIPPGAFLPVAEHFYLASRIDRWVISEIFEWLSIHEQQLNHIETISINLSGQSIGDQDFHDFVYELLKTSSVNCNKICFEITETSTITNIVKAKSFMESMKILGIKFSLDDFGSGLSSFGYLKTLPTDFLKIDGQFIRNLLEDPVDLATVRCMAEVAKVTGKMTIAEWVETEEVEKILAEIGVDFVQGYFRHKPSPLNELLKQFDY